MAGFYRSKLVKTRGAINLKFFRFNKYRFKEGLILGEWDTSLFYIWKGFRYLKLLLALFIGVKKSIRHWEDYI